jgi:hypothetical protein
MTPRAAMVYLLWYGEAAIAGHTPTEEEFQKFKDARQVSMGMACRLMRIKESDYAYTPGQSYKA